MYITGPANLYCSIGFVYSQDHSGQAMADQPDHVLRLCQVGYFPLAWNIECPTIKNISKMLNSEFRSFETEFRGFNLCLTELRWGLDEILVLISPWLVFLFNIIFQGVAR